ncbi:uncharacterized protein CMC5_020330 [Chondromyces crocatus]|uniref:Uncharacterized protein n=1 Tax=Chondromyces crocatus TaxID=52 RepID=A0A0K1EAI9_CHOCO|nr:uncharacterized protein CMC5_020330 [Chondromyces crocatus]
MPSEQVAGASVANGCGVFVSATGKEGAPGTKEALVKSLVEAITRAREGGTGRVYACAEDFEEAAELRGASSIAVLVEGLPLELVRTVLVAGDGGEGEAGAAHAGAAQAGEDGNDGGEACSGAAVFGGFEKVNDCGTPEDTTDDSKGGTGGLGQASRGVDGSNGTPVGTPNRGRCTCSTPVARVDVAVPVATAVLVVVALAAMPSASPSRAPPLPPKASRWTSASPAPAAWVPLPTRMARLA